MLREIQPGWSKRTGNLFILHSFFLDGSKLWEIHMDNQNPENGLH